jgi:ferritin-like metal-binding protein YciE
MNMKTLQDLLEHELQDAYSAEDQIIEALPLMISKATNNQLRTALSNHLEQTKKHQKLIEDIASDRGLKLGNMACKGMQGIIQEGAELLESSDEEGVRDAAIIIAAQRVEHYEIALYGSLAAHAKEMELMDVVNRIIMILQEEYEADSLLTDIAERRINEEAEEDTTKLYA